MRNIDETLMFLESQRESDFENYFENANKNEELNSIINSETSQENIDNIELDDASYEKVYNYLDNENDTYDKQMDSVVNEGDDTVYTNVQSHLEDIWIFNNILKDTCKREFGDIDSFGTCKRLTGVCDAILNKLERHGLDFSHYEGLKEYEEGQQQDIDYYLDNLMEDEDLKRSIERFYKDYCDYNYYQHSEGSSIYLN